MTPEHLRSHLADELLPLWWEHGWDRDHGGTHSRLSHQLEPRSASDGFKRTVVQARQVYAYGQIALAGATWAREPAAAQLEWMIDHCWDAQHGGWFLTTTPEGEPLDRTKDTYAQSFALLAIATHARLERSREALARAERTLELLDAHLCAPGQIGLVDAASPDWKPLHDARRQNPHMHLFEASLAMAAAGDAASLARAEALGTLLETRFFDPASGHLREFFDPELRPLSGDDGDVVEPGHEFEWAALLDLRARQTGQALPDVARGLYEAGVTALDAQGFVPMAKRLDGRPKDASRRTWSQTEALRAHLAFARCGDSSAAVRAEELARAIFAVHLDPAPAGAWIDHYDADGAPRVAAITAATGYHVVTAFIELIETAAP